MPYVDLNSAVALWTELDHAAARARRFAEPLAYTEKANLADQMDAHLREARKLIRKLRRRGHPSSIGAGGDAK